MTAEDSEFNIAKLHDLLNLQDQRLKVLVVDDSEVVRSEMRRILPTETIDIIEAEDGVVGLTRLKTSPDVGLVFLDVNMPNMDGLTMAERVAAEVKAGRQKSVPLIMLTTEGDKDMVLRAKKAGVAAWIIKPPRRKHVLMILEKVFTARIAADRQREGA